MVDVEKWHDISSITWEDLERRKRKKMENFLIFSRSEQSLKISIQTEYNSYGGILVCFKGNKPYFYGLNLGFAQCPSHINSQYFCLEYTICT